MIPDVTHDSIIEEIQSFRREHAAKFGYDLEAIFRDLKEAERLSGRAYVQRPPRRLAVVPGASAGPPAITHPKSKPTSHV